MPRALARAIAWVAAVAGLACLTFPIAAPSDWLFRAPREREEKARTRLARYLAGHKGLQYALTFDEPAPGEFFTDSPMIYSGTVAGPGRHGQARKFDGRERTQIETPLNWEQTSPSFTLSFWVNVSKGRPDQCIWYRADHTIHLGFHLEEGRMTFDLPGMAERQSLAYPFEAYGEFVHLAATVDSERGIMALYENGTKKAEAPCRYEGMPVSNLGFGKPIWYATRNPFKGWLDEATVWNRSLSEKEVRRLARSRRGVLWAWGGNERYLKWQLARAWTRTLGKLAGIADVLAPLTPRGYREMQAIRRLPEVKLVISGKARRELIAAHHRSRKSGRRTQAGARPRLVHVAFEGAVYPAWIQLAGGDMDYADRGRAGYELELLDGAQVLGARRLMLRPPENGDWLFPLVDSRIRKRLGLPTVATGLCRLHVNGMGSGVYLYSNHDRGGYLPGDLRESRTDSFQHSRRWFRLFPQIVRKEWEASSARMVWPLSLRERESLYDAGIGDWAPCLLGDLQNPLSRKEIQWSLNQGRERIPAVWPVAADDLSLAQKVAGFLDEFMVLGSNASPDRLVAPLDLDLAELRKSGVDIRWSSTDPGVLGPDGKIQRPAAGGPVGVQLVATVDDGQEAAEKTLAFRVMPQNVVLPALFLNVRNAMDKTHRVDAMVEWCEPGEDFPSRTLFATQGSRGGVEHRGNSSYWNRKKLFSIKADEPHRILDESARRVLLAVNSEQDPTFIRNRLAYEIFRSWGTAAAPRMAPHVRPAEVFVNGRYHGLFEFSARVDETLLDEGVSPTGDQPGEGRWILYRHESVYPRTPNMRARRPGQHEGDFSGPYADFCRFLERPTDGTWERELARNVDLPNLADFQLLLNLFQNRNGYPFKFPMHEALIYDRAAAIFFHVPWDFELTPQLGQWEWLQNGLMRRLENESSGYAPLLAARWRELRRGGLTPEALEARIDELARDLRGYVEWDYRRWGYGSGQEYESRLENFKALLRESMVYMDRRLEE